MAWRDHVGNPQLGNRHVFLRRFRSNGVALDVSDIPLSTTFRPVNNGVQNGLASLRSGAMAAVWGSGSINDPPPKVAYMRRLDAQASPLDGSESVVPGGATDWHDRPSIARLDDTDYVVTWNAVGDGLYVRRVLADGSSSNEFGYRVSPRAVTYDSGGSASTPNGSLTWIAWSGPGRVAYFRRARLKGAPVAREDVASTDSGQPIAIDVLANDADPDPKDELTIISAQATTGTARIEDGQVIYEPPHNCGETSDWILYEIRDLQGNTAEGKVRVTINQTPYMRVTPPTLTRLYGAVGGPFPEPWGAYTIRNDGRAPMNWVVGRTANWLSRTPASGTLAAGASVNVTLRAAGAVANALPAGLHTGVARFRNQSGGLGNTNRTVRLTVVSDWGQNAVGQGPTLAGTSGTTWSSNVNANGQPNEPDHAGVSQPLASVWWQWTAPQSGTAVFHTDGSSFDTTLAVYTGGPNPARLSEVASNDDFASFPPQSRVVFQAVAGTTYRIAVDGKGAQTGLIKLNWSMP